MARNDQNAWEEKAAISETTKRDIIKSALKAWPRSDGLDDILNLVTGVAFVEHAIDATFEAIESMLLGRNLSPRERELERLKALSRHMKDAWNDFSRNKDSLLPRDRGESFRVLQEVQTGLNVAWDEWKREGAELYEAREAAFEDRRDRKRRLVSNMRSLVDSADDRDAGDRAKQLMAEWKTIGFSGADYEDDLWSDFKEAMDRFYAERKMGNILRIRNQIDNQEAFVSRMSESADHDEEVLEEKREKLANVFEGRRADEIRAHLESVIESLENKIESKRDKIREVEGDIEALKDRLRDLM